MKKENLYIAQIGEAIKYYNDGTYEYQRLSIILLDNVIEVILKTKLKYHIYQHYRNTLSRDEIETKIKSLNYHENVTKEAFCTKLISEDERRILDFCHEIRNTQYHEPSEYSYVLTKDNNYLIKCGVLCLVEFLISNYIALTKNEIIEFSFTTSQREKLIFEKNSIKIPEQILLKLAECFSYADKRPAEIIGDIIKDDIVSIEEFYECDAGEEWNKFNNIVIRYFEEYTKQIKRSYVKKNELLNFPKINSKKINERKKKIEEIRKLETSKAIEGFNTFTDEYNKVLIGIKMYQCEQERIAYENED